MRKCVLGRILVSYLLRNACLLRRMSDVLAMVDLLSSMNPLSSAVAWNRVTLEKSIYMLLGGAIKLCYYFWILFSSVYKRLRHLHIR